MGRRDIHTWSWWGKLKERGHLNDLGIYRRVILKYIEKIYVVELYVFHILVKFVTSPVQLILLPLITGITYGRVQSVK